MPMQLKNRITLEVAFFLVLFLATLNGSWPQDVNYWKFFIVDFCILYAHAAVNRFFIFIPCFNKKLISIYVVLTLINLSVFGLINYYHSTYFIRLYEPESIHNFNFATALSACFLSLFVMCSIEFVFQYLRVQAQKNKFELAMNQFEINQLKSQLNPHFLFNCLNNAYGLSLTDAAKSSEYIMSLSQLMRYQIEGSKKDLLMLGDDIEFIEHYIVVEKQRIDKRCTIQFINELTELQRNSFQIAPLLFLPFIENAIKHGTATRNQSFINIFITMNNNELKFTCKNSIPQHKTYVKGTETGLANIKSRLELLYPKKHTLNIEESLDDYFIELNLKLKVTHAI
jgi:two-component system, LytTR family, sensor kinase